MNEQVNVQVIRETYAAFNSGDIDSILDVLSDDVEWQVPGPSKIPYAGTYHGKRGAAEFFKTLAQTEDTQLFEQDRYFANGDQVVVLGRYAARLKQTGKIAQAELVHVFTMREGKITKFQEYLDDTAKYATAYEGLPQTAMRR
jgi:ketosteroid isomerase-like protein